MIDIVQTLTELTAPPIEDRLRVVESLWDSIPAASPVEISPDQLACVMADEVRDSVSPRSCR